MKSHLYTAVLLTAVVALGCQGGSSQRVPGPRSALAQESPGSSGERAAADGQRRNTGASEISWFQGTLEEAFSPRGCQHGAPFHL